MLTTFPSVAISFVVFRAIGVGEFLIMPIGLTLGTVIFVVLLKSLKETTKDAIYSVLFVSFYAGFGFVFGGEVGGIIRWVFDAPVNFEIVFYFCGAILFTVVFWQYGRKRIRFQQTMDNAQSTNPSKLK